MKNIQRPNMDPYLVWSAINGATEAIYAAPTTAIGTTFYYCIITETDGSSIVKTTSDVAAVTVTAVPLSATISVSVNGIKQTFTTDISSACAAYTAIYDSNDKLLGVGSTQLEQNQGAASISLTISSLPAVYTTKLFLLGSSYKPICDYYHSSK